MGGSHNKQKIAVGILAASLGFFGLVKEKEGFTSKPIVPTKGDVPTIGHGTTVYPDGTKVKMTDKPITRKTAEYYLRHHVNKTERELKNSISQVALSQTEYDVYLDFVYQYGIGAFNKSSMRTNLLHGQYAHTRADSLSKQLTQANSRIKTAKREAVEEYARVQSNVLSSCITEYRNMAKVADEYRANVGRKE